MLLKPAKDSVDVGIFVSDIKKSLSRPNFLTSGHCGSGDDLYATIAML